MRLGAFHARAVAKALEAKALDRKLICDRCGQEVIPAAWSVHRTQFCPGPKETLAAHERDQRLGDTDSNR